MDHLNNALMDDYPVRVKIKTIEALLHHCGQALQLLNTNDTSSSTCVITQHRSADYDAQQSTPTSEAEVHQLCDLIKSRVECPDFLDKLACAQASVSLNTPEEGNSWDIVNKNDLWDGEVVDLDSEDYVHVRQEDIVEGIACFMATYLLSLNQTKDLTPIQLQEALSTTFSVKMKKGKLQKAWDGSKAIYNVASWGATAIGIYQNPVILRAAIEAFWTSCHVISKLL